MPTPCNAPPGWFCSPLNNRPTICPENWYCPGGEVDARKCPDGRWSAVQSVYPEDCLDHMNAGMAILFVLFISVIVLFVCMWYARWDSKAMKDGGFPDAEPYATYGAVNGLCPGVIFYTTVPRV
jgi:hypothetical protein